MKLVLQDLCRHRPPRAITLVQLLIAVMAVSAIGLKFGALYLTRVAPADTHFFFDPRDTAEQVAVRAERKRIAKGGEYYKPLQVVEDLAAVEEPEMLAVAQVDLPESTAIVGIEVDGQAFAFALDPMRKVEQHIVSLKVNETPVAVTYCDLVDCVRVLSDDSEALIPLRVGGLDVDDELVFLLDQTRYAQSSPDLPLSDYPFSRTTLGEWTREHPDTRIFCGVPETENKISDNILNGGPHTN